MICEALVSSLGLSGYSDDIRLNLGQRIPLSHLSYIFEFFYQELKRNNFDIDIKAI